MNRNPHSSVRLGSDASTPKAPPRERWFELTENGRPAIGSLEVDAAVVEELVARMARGGPKAQAGRSA